MTRLCALILLAGSLPAMAQVALTPTFTGPTSYTPGASASYTITVQNTGDAAEDSLAITTNFPAGVTLGAVTCSSPATGSTCSTNTAGNDLSVSGLDLAPGATATFTLPVTYASSMTVDPLTVTATISASVAVSDPSVSSTLALEADLSVTKTASGSTYTPGTAVDNQFTIVVSNTGPSDASGVTLTDTAPTGMTITNWNCTPVADCPANSGSGNISQALAPDAGVTLTYTVDVSYLSSLPTDPLTNTASLTVPASLNDPDSDDQSDSVDLGRNAIADLRLEFGADDPSTYVPGGATVDIDYTVTNDGPSDSEGAILPLIWGTQVSNATWACSPSAACSVLSAADGGSGNNTVGAGSGTGDEVLAVDLTASSSVTLSATLEFDSGARTDYVLSPTANAAGETDDDAANSTDTLTLTVDRQADIAVIKTAPAFVNPGDDFLYEIRVENRGPSDLGPDPVNVNPTLEVGLELTDIFDGTLLGSLSCADVSIPCWEVCTDDLGATGDYTADNCPGAVIATGGDIVELPINLAAGSSTTVQVFARTDGNASGSIDNTATIVIGAEVTEVPLSPPGPNQSTVTTDIDLSTDLSVTKNDDATTAVAGEEHSYTIVLRNNGTISAQDVTLSDALPVFDPVDFGNGIDSPGFITGTSTWQCSAFNGACCNSNSTNCGVGTPTAPRPVSSDPNPSVINDILDVGVDLPGQSYVEFTITGTIDPRAFGTLSNTASLTPPAGLNDSNSANNDATDSDTVLVRQAGLVVEKSLRSLVSVAGDDSPPFRLVYDISIVNTGPSFVPDASVSDPLGPSFDLATASWTCLVTETSGQTACDAASGAGVLATMVDLDPDGRVDLVVTVDTTDPVSGEVTNTVTVDTGTAVFRDSATTSLIGEARLFVTKTDSRAEIAPGDEIEYTIRIQNEGPDDVFGATVIDQFPLDIDGLAWSCQATTPIPGDIEFLEEAGIGLSNKAGDALVVSPDGLHAYVIGNSDDALYAYSRNATPGFNFGRVTLIETETNGIDDAGDAGPSVAGMNGPIDVVISPDGFVVHVLSIDVDDGPSIASFGRVVNPAAANFGELTYLGNTSAGMPLQPTAMAITAGNLYVSGAGDPDGEDGNTADLVSIFEIDSISGLPIHDFNQLDDLPVSIATLVADGPGELLFVGGSSIAMFTIDEADAGIPAGRLTFVDNYTGASSTTEFAVADDAPHLYARSVLGGTNRLLMLAYADGGGVLGFGMSPDFNYSSADFVRPAGSSGPLDPLEEPGAPDPLVGSGGIAVSPDGEHLAGVNATGNLMYVFRREPSGGLTFQESEVFDLADAPDDQGGLEGAREVQFTPDGRHLLVAASAEGEVGSPVRDTNLPLSVYTRLAPDPLFAFIEHDRDGDPVGPGIDIDGLQAPNDVVISPDGAHVYTVSLPDDSLVRFDRFPRLGLDQDSLGQHLQYAETYAQGIDGVDGLGQPRRILISPNGANVFVTSEANDSVAVFARETDSMDPDFGALTFRQVLSNSDSGVDGIAGAQGMAMDSTSSHLYVAGSFGASIARFDLVGGLLEYSGLVSTGVDGVVGLSGIRDLAITDNDAQLLGVSTLSNAVVVFDRDASSASGTFGELSFVQALQTSIGVRPVSIAIAPSGTENPPSGGAHVYVASQNSNSVAVLRRVTDPSSSAFGQVQPIQLLVSGVNNVEFMQGPRDVQVSPDGKRVYVAAEFSDAVLVFDRDLNSTSSSFGALSLVEIRRDSVRGVDGLRQVRGLAVSGDSRNVYATGFGDRSVASFRLGTGSVCTAGGSGSILDRVDIGAGGTIEYIATGTVRPNATGTLVNDVAVTVPENFVALMPQAGCPLGGDYCAQDSTTLVPEGTVTVEKTSEQVSVTAGETAEYTITINNSGPSSLVHEPGFPLTVSDLLDSNPAFVPGSAVWSCVASGSGSLDFLDAQFDLIPMTPETPQSGGPFDALRGISGLALVPGSVGSWLVGASVLDDALSVFTRDPVTGELLSETTVRSGDLLDGNPVDFLDGAQSVVVSADGQFIYVASRVSDSVTVLSIADDGMGNPDLGWVQDVTGQLGLNQAVDLVLSPEVGQSNLYVAGANDDAIAVFSRDVATGELTWIQSVQQNAPSVTGLQDVSTVRVSPDGDHVYALSPTSGRVTLFDRMMDGQLAFRRGYGEGDLGIRIAGASSLVFDANGQFVYVSAEIDNRIAVLERTLGSPGSDGELVLRSSVSQGDAGVNGLVGARQLALTADGVHLYATSQAGSSVAWFIRDEETGGLSFGGLRGNDSGGQVGLGGATGLVVDNDLDQVFVAGTLQSAISRFQRAADSFCPASGTGELVDVEFNIGAGGSVVFTITVDVRGSATGEIVNTATVEAARDPLNPVQTATDTNVVATETDLSITKDDGLREYDGLSGATDVVAAGLHTYTAASTDNAIGIFRRDSNSTSPTFGDLEFIDAIRAGQDGVAGVNGVRDLVVSPDGRHIYSASPLENGVASFARDDASGALDFLGLQQNGVLGVSGLSGAAAVTISADGAHVYAVGEFSNAIATFRRETDTASPDFGRLTFLEFDQNGVNGVGGTGAPVALAASADGRHVYVAGAEEDTLIVFERNRLAASAGFGQLEYVTHYTQNVDGVAGLGAIRDVEVSADGLTVYALGAATGTLAWFARDASTGELSFVNFKQDGTSGTTGLTGAASMLLDEIGESLYVAGSETASITRFSIDSEGAPDFAGIIRNGDPSVTTGGQVFGLEGVGGLAQAPDGAHLYAASAGRGAILTFVQEMTPSALDFQQILIDGLGGVAPGTLVEYVIRVENLGPSDVPQARVVDQFPDGFESVSWLCSGQAGTGGACLSSGSGDIDEIVNLPVGGIVTFRASGTISAGATGRLINTATVAAIGVADLNQSNNSATDDDTVLSPSADLIVDVDNGIDSPDFVVPGDLIGYDIIVSNDGPSSMRGVFVEDIFPPALFDTTWSCTAVPAAGILAAPLDVAAPFLPEGIAFTEDGRWGYAAAGDAVQVYQRDPLTGDLQPVQLVQNGIDAVTGIRGAKDVVISTDGRFVYVAGADSDAIALFGRDDGTGELEFVSFWQDGLGGIEGLGGVLRLLLAPDGAYLYAAGGEDNALAVFAINGANGTITQTGRLAQGEGGVDGLNGIQDMTFSADASLLLVVADANQSLATFDRTNSTGALDFVEVLLNDDLLGGPAEDSLLGATRVLAIADDEILVAASASDRIGRFVLRTEDVAGVESTRPVPVGLIDAAGLGTALTAPTALAYDPDRARLYVAEADSLLLLNLLAETPLVVERYAATDFPVLTGVNEVLVGPNLRQLYTLGTSVGAEIGVWGRERGSRCPLSGTGNLGRQEVDIVSGGQLVYRVDGRVRANATGTLDFTVSVENPDPNQEVDPGSNVDTDSDLLGPAPDLEVGKTLETAPIVAGLPVDWTISVNNLGLSDAPGAIVTDQPPIFPVDSNGILAGSGSWSCDANLPLSDSTPYPSPEAISSLALDPSGNWLYATSSDSASLLIFPVDAAGVPGTATVIRNGDSFPQAGSAPDLVVTGMAGASDVTAASNGLHVYVTGATGNSILVFAREQLGDPLQYVETFTTETPPGSGSVPGLRGARAVALSADERYVFVAGAASNAIAVFERDPNNGTLTFVERVADGIGTIVPEFDVIRDVAALHISELGTDLYAIAESSEAISRFSINDESGVLTFEQVLRAGGGIPDLGGMRDLAVAPGDTHLYALTDAGVAIFSRDSDGSLAFESMFDPGSGAADAAALVVDGSGSRAYLLATGTGSPTVHVLRRDWIDGSLEFWFSQTIGGAIPAALVQAESTGHLLVGGSGPELLRFDEQPLSRCAETEGISDALITTVDLGVDGTSNFGLSAIVHPSARGILDNTVTAAPGIGIDPDTANNSATVSGPITVISDLAVSKTGPAEAVAGTVISYTITVTNAGPSDALGIQVTDLAPAPLLEFDWTCSASFGSTCPASGATVPDFTADVLVGGQLDITLQALIDPAFIGDLINVVLLTPEVGATDPTPDDQRAEHSTTVRAESDVVVSKDVLTDPVVAGLPVDYLVTVFNVGPSLATGVQVVDTLPATLLDAVWTCIGFDGAICPASGSGSVDFTVAMPPASSLEIAITGGLDPAATGMLTNAASAAVIAPVDDPDSSNNSAQVTSPINVVPDIELDLNDPLDPFDPAGPIGMPYFATITNLGPSRATGLELLLDVSAPITPQSPGCVNPTDTTIRCATSPLLPGESKVFELVLFDLPAAPATLVIDGLAVTTDDDPDLLNNVDSTSTELRNGPDLDVGLSNNRTWVSPDEDLTYELSIANIGSVNAPIVDIALPVPAELLDPQWSCQSAGGATCQASGSGDITDTVSVPSGGSLTYTLTATVDPDIDLSVPQSVVMSALAETSPPSADINPANNVAADIDEIRLIMFSDGFETLVRVPEIGQTLSADCNEVTADKAGALMGTMVEGRDASGNRLFWVEVTSRGERDWIQTVALGPRSTSVSDWMEWTDGPVVIRIEGLDLRVDLPGGRGWQAEQRLPARVLRLVQPEQLAERSTRSSVSVDVCTSGGAL